MEQNYIPNKNLKKEINSYNLSDNSLLSNSNKVMKTFSNIRKNLLEITKEDINNSNKLSVKSYKIDFNSIYNKDTINDGLNNIQNDIRNNINNIRSNIRNNINNVQYNQYIINYIYNDNEIIEHSPEIDDQEQTVVEENNKYDNECSSSDISD